MRARLCFQTLLLESCSKHYCWRVEALLGHSSCLTHCCPLKFLVFFNMSFLNVFGLYIYLGMCLVPAEDRRRHWISWKWSYRQPLWVLEIKPKSSGRASNALNYWGISSALELEFLRTLYLKKNWSNLPLAVYIASIFISCFSFFLFFKCRFCLSVCFLMVKLHIPWLLFIKAFLFLSTSGDLGFYWLARHISSIRLYILFLILSPYLLEFVSGCSVFPIEG